MRKFRAKYFRISLYFAAKKRPWNQAFRSQIPRPRGFEYSYKIPILMYSCIKGLAVLTLKIAAYLYCGLFVKIFALARLK